MPLNLLDADYRRDPYPHLARARAEEPIHHDEMGVWYATRHADVAALNKDPRFGRDLRKWTAYPMLRPYVADSPLERCVELWMFSIDPPEHTRLRRLVAQAFSPRAVAAMRPAIEAVVDELIDGLPAGEVDIMPAFAQPFPVRVIARILGLSLDDYDSLREWSDAIAQIIEPTSRRKQRLHANEVAIELMAYLRAQVAARRSSPGSDVITDLIRAEEEGDRLSEEELIAQLVLLFIAGHETTTNLIGNGLLALCRNQGEQSRLRADPALSPGAVEEMLRFDSPVNTNARVAHGDITIDGQTIPEGALMLCMLGAANRDPAVFADPDRFDITRSPNAHVSFGGGVHMCLGAQVARLEAQIAFERLLRRSARIDVVEDGVVWHDKVNIRGMRALPVQLN